jgi:NADH-quinone oxidoreductase subunit M
MLWMFQRVYYGSVTREENATLPDLLPREWCAVVPLVAVALFMGIFPAVFLRPMQPSVQKVVQRVQTAESLRVRSEIQGSKIQLNFDFQF